MRRPQGRVLRLLASVGLLAVAIAAITSASSAAPSGAVRVAIMSDCKGAFGFAQETASEAPRRPLPSSRAESRRTRRSRRRA